MKILACFAAVLGLGLAMPTGEGDKSGAMVSRHH